jgi:osmoprotectant transport system ATP-binding protein
MTDRLPPLVEFRNVTCGYTNRIAVDRLNLQIARGEAVALVGRSGAGKSTLLKLVNRLLVPDRGQVLVERRDTREWDPIALRRRTGYVLQHIGLFPTMTVEQNVSVVPRLEGWNAGRQRSRAHDLLDMVGLPPGEFGERWPHELSGGQQQRVGVARALALEPPVVLRDERFGALVAVTRNELLTLVRRIQRDLQQTLLLVTHDIAEAAVLGTRIGVLDDGALIACDTPAAIWNSQHPRVRQLLDAVPVTPAHR